MIQALFKMAARCEAAVRWSDSEWAEALALADRTQLTLYLRGLPGLPGWVASAIESRYRRNLERRRRLRAAFLEISEALDSAGVEFILLKGFTHEAALGIEGGLRVQYDLDLLCAPSGLAGANEVLQCLGYAPHGRRPLSGEHARPLVRPSNWRWRGDYYDPEMPIPVELHASLWNAAREHLNIGGLGQVWNRRTRLEIDGLSIPALDETDRAAFAALHVLRHILRHDARPAHALELARFLDRGKPLPYGRGSGSRRDRQGADDSRFWNRWRELYDARLRGLQAVAFRFAHEWFECAFPEQLQAEWRMLPMPAIEWFRDFAWSPVENLLGPNKDTVWLHMALAASRRDRVRIFCDRLVPLRLPHRDESAPYLTRLFRRIRYHAGALAPALLNGVRCWRRRTAASIASQTPD